MKRIRIGILLLAAAALLTACGGSASSRTAASASSEAVSSETTAVSSEAAVSESAAAEPSALDGIKFTVSKVRKDNTGNWRISCIAENLEMKDHALEYYNQYFTDDSEIHFIVNFNYNTTTKIMVSGGQLDVTVQDYVPKEEHDASVLGSGTVLTEYLVDKDTGEIEQIR